MKHVFLDTNILFNDPFFKLPSTISLLLLCEQKKIKLYITDINVYEVKKHVLEQFSENLKKVKDGISELNKNSYSDLPDFNERITDYCDIDKKYNELVDLDYLEILSSDNIKINQLMERYLVNKKPFTKSRNSFQDCAIWLTIMNYIRNNSMNDYYLIANNPADFSEEDKQKKDILHEDLRADLPDLKYFLGLNSFYDDEEINSLLKEIQNTTTNSEKVKTWITNNIQNPRPNNGLLVLSWATSVLTNQFIEDFFNDNLIDCVSDALSDTCSEKPAIWFGSFIDGDLIEFDDFGLDSILVKRIFPGENGSITVSGTVDVDAGISISTYHEREFHPTDGGYVLIRYYFSLEISEKGKLINHSFYDEEIISPLDLQPDEEQLDADNISIMKEWFFSHYEDPAERTPFESKDGGYQWIYGGPYEVEQELFKHFSKEYSEDEIRKTADEIQTETGIYDWTSKND